MMKWITAIALAVCLCGSQTALAQGKHGSTVRAKNWETRASLIFQDSSDARFKGGTEVNFDSSIGFSLGAGYHYTEHWEFGGSMEFNGIDYRSKIASADNPGESYSTRGDVQNTTLLGDVTYHFLAGPLTPYVTGALGWNWMNTDVASGPPATGCWWDPWWGYVCSQFQPTRTLDGFVYQLGIGLRYDLNGKIALDALYRKSWLDYSNTSSQPDTDAIVFSFGWKW